MSVNTGAIQPTAGLYTPYSTYMYDTLDSLDLNYSTYPYGMNGMYGGSIFSTPYMYGGGGMNNQEYFNNMKQYQQFYNNYNLEQQQMYRNMDLKLNGSMEAIKETASNLRDKILHNEQDQIMETYKNYVAAVRNAYGDGTAEEINSRALSLYTQLTGKTLIQDLRDNGHDSFLQGFIQTLTLGMYSRNSVEDNISAITGQSVPSGEKLEQNIGRVGGAVAMGAGAYGLTKALEGNTSAILKGFSKFAKGKAGRIGLIVAGIAGALAFITGRITSSN